MCCFRAARRCGLLSPCRSDLTQDNETCSAPSASAPPRQTRGRRRGLCACAAQAHLEPVLLPSGEGGSAIVSSRWARGAHVGQEASPGGIRPGTPRNLEAEARAHARSPLLPRRLLRGRGTRRPLGWAAQSQARRVHPELPRLSSGSSAGLQRRLGTRSAKRKPYAGRSVFHGLQGDTDNRTTLPCAT